MKRTTLALEDDLLRRLKADAARRGTTLARTVNDLLRQSLAAAPKRKTYALAIKGWDAELQPGVNILDRDTLFDVMDGR